MKRLVCMVLVLMLILSVFVMPVAAQAETAPVMRDKAANEWGRASWHLSVTVKNFEMRNQDGCTYIRFKVRNDSNFAITKLMVRFVAYENEWMINEAERVTKTISGTIKAHKTAWTKWIALEQHDRYYVTRIKPIGGSVTWDWFDFDDFYVEEGMELYE